MFLTELKVDITKNGSYRIHQLVQSMFPGVRRPLFHVGPGGVVRILSEHIVQDKPFDETSMVFLGTRKVSVPEEGAFVPFKVRYCACVSKKDALGRHKRLSTPDTDTADAKLKNAVSSQGAEIMQSFINFEGFPIVQKGAMTIPMATHQVVGVLQIKNKAVFSELLLSGVGSARFAGWGMLDIF